MAWQAWNGIGREMATTQKRSDPPTEQDWTAPGSNAAVKFGREVCGSLEIAERREWLVTNGIGGYASGTVSGDLTRRYHGLLHHRGLSLVTAFDGATPFYLLSGVAGFAPRHEWYRDFLLPQGDSGARQLDAAAKLSVARPQGIARKLVFRHGRQVPCVETCGRFAPYQRE